MGYDLSFVNLGITIEHMRNSITVFGFRIAFYGIIIGIGMMAAVLLCSWDWRSRGQKDDIIMDLAVYGILFGVAGARLYYVLFRWDDYKNDLLQIFNLRAGGLAIYGGVIAGLLVVWVISRRYGKKFTSVSDTVVLGILTGQILGRWGNFFNCEAFGAYTESLFAMRIKKSLVNPIMIDEALSQHVILENGIEYIQVHPTFLYESAWNLCLLILLLYMRKRKKADGEIMFLYLSGYGLGRMIIEGLRTDSLLVPGTGLAVSQLLAGACFVICGIVVIRMHLHPQEVLSDMTAAEAEAKKESPAEAEQESSPETPETTAGSSSETQEKGDEVGER